MNIETKFIIIAFTIVIIVLMLWIFNLYSALNECTRKYNLVNPQKYSLCKSWDGKIHPYQNVPPDECDMIPEPDIDVRELPLYKKINKAGIFYICLESRPDLCITVREIADGASLYLAKYEGTKYQRFKQDDEKIVMAENKDLSISVQNLAVILRKYESSKLLYPDRKYMSLKDSNNMVIHGSMDGLFITEGANKVQAKWKFVEI